MGIWAAIVKPKKERERARAKGKARGGSKKKVLGSSTKDDNAIRKKSGYLGGQFGYGS